MSGGLEPRTPVKVPLDDDSEEAQMQISAIRAERDKLTLEMDKQKVKRDEGLVSESDFAKFETRTSRRRLELLSREIEIGLEPGRVLEKIREIVRSPKAATKLIYASLAQAKDTILEEADRSGSKKPRDDSSEAGRSDSHVRRNMYRWKKDTIKAYGAAEGDLRWCCLTGSWLDPNIKFKLAHLVPVATRSEVVENVFDILHGDDAIWDSANTLPLMSAAKERFGRGQWVIIPVPRENDQGEDPYDYQVRVLDRSILNFTVMHCINLKFQDLDRKFLQFRTNFRPNKRYLFYHFITSLQVAESRNFLDWNDVLQVIKAWAPTPGHYVRRGIMRGMAQAIGRPDFKQAVEDAKLTIPDGDYTLCDDLISACIMLEALGRSLQANTQDYESDNEEDGDESSIVERECDLDSLTDRSFWNEDDEEERNESVREEVESLHINESIN